MNEITVDLTKFSPLLNQSQQYKITVGQVNITDSQSLKDGVELKKQLTTFIKNIEEARKIMTVPLDEKKKEIMEQEKIAKAPAEEAKAEITSKIISYEEEIERQRQAELQRIAKICAGFRATQLHNTIEKNEEVVAKINSDFKLLSESDQKDGSIRLAVTEILSALSKRIDDIKEINRQKAENDRLAKIQAEQNAEQAKLEAQRIEQARIQREQEQQAKQLKDDQDRLALEKARQIQAETLAKQQAKATVSTGTRTFIKMEIIDPSLVPREFCSPDSTLINNAIKNGKREIPGVRIFEEKK